MQVSSGDAVENSVEATVEYVSGFNEDMLIQITDRLDMLVELLVRFNSEFDLFISILITLIICVIAYTILHYFVRM